MTVGLPRKPWLSAKVSPGMNTTGALAFVRRHGLVLERARGPVPNLAEAIAGARIRGSWWGHPKAQKIFSLTRAVRGSRFK